MDSLEISLQWWQLLIGLLGTMGGLEGIRWLANRGTEKRLNGQQVRQGEFALEEQRINELHAMLETANNLNDSLLRRLSEANAAVDKHIDRNRELSDRTYRSEQEVNRINDLLTAEQRKTAKLEHDLGLAWRVADTYKEWHCRRSTCTDGRIPPNDKLAGKVFAAPAADTTDKPQSL